MKARVLVVDDEIRYRELYSHVLSSAGFEILTAATAEAALQLIAGDKPDLVVSDVRLPGASGIELLRVAREAQAALPFLLVTAYADVRDAVKALKLGAVDYLAKPVDLEELLAAVRDALGVRAEAADLNIPSQALTGIVAESPAILAVLKDAYRVAPSNVNVLLIGESGTGKEILAQFLHRNSPRARNPLVAVNCAAIPATLLGSELFGHEKGAFTGAVAKRLGRFREADGGTLFLDEIGDLPSELQAALLRAIETGRITPLGSDREVEVDYRLVAATNRNLVHDLETGRFRQDLYYRLNVITIEIPPLRERPEDILPLARHFLTHGEAEGRRLSRAAAKALNAHQWPGNVRELANAMEHARLLCLGDTILPEHLPPAVREAAARSAVKNNETVPTLDVKTLQASELETIRRALEQTNGNRTRAAEILGITRRGLIYKMKRLGVK
ncbi:MAG: sigma-54-dependent Fis family transcriptional regulator [Deltaproteobacteria bacterium]|nr:sigma-54-dependent Fis family transcriptional regulator [Deltaproteobacteria bacterium]